MGNLVDGQGGEHGKRLLERNHYRQIWKTRETPQDKDLDEFETRRQALGDLIKAEERADKSWYKDQEFDIPILPEPKGQKAYRLSRYSSFVAKVEPIKQIRLYVLKEDRDEANRRLEAIKE